MTLIHKEDPAAVIWREIGDDLKGFDISAQGVLVATYKRADDAMTSGGVILAHQVVKDDEFQSKAGLVVMLGRRAFVDDEHVQWHGYRCDVGDWVMFKASEGMKMAIGGPGGAHVSLLSDVFLKIKIPTCNSVF